MISTTRRLAYELNNLPVEKFIVVIDEDDNEYMIDSIVKRNTHSDDNFEWNYALKIHKTSSGYIKR